MEKWTGITALIIIIIAAIVVVSYVMGTYHKGGTTTTIINGPNYTFGLPTVYYQGDKISNFLLQKINPNNVTGLSYIWYPVATTEGTPETLHIGDSIGYNCDGSLKVLTAINSNSVIFTNASSGSRYGGCPI